MTNKLKDRHILNFVFVTTIVITSIAAFIFSMFLTGCHSNLSIDNVNIYKDSNNGRVQISIITKDFNNLGFNYGDSVDIAFSNGVTYMDVPYFNNYYYAKSDELVLCGRKDGNNLSFGLYHGNSSWDFSNLNTDDTVTISLKESSKYEYIQNAMDLEYSNTRSDYSDDETFANFRSIKGGKLKDNTVFRSASPCDNSKNRAKFANDLAQKAAINFFINISDTEKEYNEYYLKDDFNSFYYNDKKNAGNVVFLCLSASYYTDEFKKGTAAAFKDIISHDGPYLIHCLEGKDRTGFYGILILGLAGADYETILNDYMLSFENYYNVSKNTNTDSYKVIKEQKFDDCIERLCNINSGEIPTNESITNGCEKYLKECGLTDVDLLQLKSKLLQY